MRKKCIVLAASATLLLGCEFESYKDYRNPDYEGVFSALNVSAYQQNAQEREIHRLFCGVGCVAGVLLFRFY